MYRFCPKRPSTSLVEYRPVWSAGFRAQTNKRRQSCRFFSPFLQGLLWGEGLNHSFGFLEIAVPEFIESGVEDAGHDLRIEVSIERDAAVSEA